MENTDGMIGVFEPMCKIRFLSDPKPEEDYIAVPASEMIDLITDQMKLMALESGGVDNGAGMENLFVNFVKHYPMTTVISSGPGPTMRKRLTRLLKNSQKTWILKISPDMKLM